MPEQDEYLIPIFLINGQLESGKTTFISELVEGGQFDDAQKKLIIALEEGEVEYDRQLLEEHGVDLEILTDEEFTKEKLEELEEKYSPWAVIMEYNGMWDPARIAETGLPEGWAIYQTITLMNAETFKLQWSNMQSIMAETVKTAESVIFNRCDLETMDLGSFRRSMKVLNPAIDVIFEDKNREIITGVNEVLPYDMDAESIDVADEDFGIWFVDARERHDAYDGKVFHFKAQVFRLKNMDKSIFVASRKAMTCCENDIATVGFIAECGKDYVFEKDEWLELTVRVGYERRNEYNDVGPVLKIIEAKKTEPPKQEIVYF